MATNHYFQSGIPMGMRSESHLHEDLIIECLKIYGFDVLYLNRESVNEDLILNEDPLNKFTNAYQIEMYLENVDGFGGDGDLMSTDLIYYSQVRQHLELINMMLIGQKPIRFNRHMNRLFIDMDWEEDVDVGDYIVIECYRILDPDTYTDVYNDRILKKYAAALIKRQWGANLKKFSGVQLPGGVQLNGQVIFDEAMQEIKEIEEETRNTYELPVDMFVG